MFVQFSEIDVRGYDAIIAGSGPAGAAVAARLARKGRRCLIIETGGADYDQDIQHNFTEIQGRGHFDGSHWASHWIRALGGTSAVWGGWCAPLLKRNFAGWPIRHDELREYYVMAAKFLFRDPAFLTLSPRFAKDFSLRPFADGEVARFGRAYMPYQKDANIHVLLETTLAALIPRPDRRGVQGLQLYAPGTGRVKCTLRDGQAVILAAGGIGNAQILLASDEDGTCTAVGNEYDQVGRYLSDHPHIYNCARMVVRADMRLPPMPNDHNLYRPAIVPDDALYEEMGGIDVSIGLRKSSPNRDDPIEALLLARTPGAHIYDLDVRTEMPHDGRNRVVRAESRNPAGMARINATCVIDSRVFSAVDLCLQRLGENLIENGMGRVRINNEIVYRHAVGGGHTMSTTRMGDDPRTSVTDRDCRVHNYGNLFVAGSSLFPTTGYANPTLTIVALATRLGDNLERLS